MASEGSSGLQVLLSTLQTSEEKDETLNILSVLSELLSAGTHRRIHYMISKGGSEALLQTLVNLSRTESLDYSLLLPLLELMVKVGQRDGRFGEKAQKLEATDVTLSLLRRNLAKHEYMTPCIYAVQVYASSVPIGEKLGVNGTMELLFKIITPYTRRHTQTVKAAIGALAALLKSKSNVRRAVNRGYVCGLLHFYQDWHISDSSHAYVPIRRGLLRCLKHITNVRSGREAFIQARGMEILYSTAQECLQLKNLDSLVSAAIQVLRKCCPKCTLPLSCINSSYVYSVPGKKQPSTTTQIYSQEDESEDEEEADINSNLGNDDSKEEDDDLETDLKKLKYKPVPDRPVEEFKQYKAYCSELFLFKDKESDTEEVLGTADRISRTYSHNIPLSEGTTEDHDHQRTSGACSCQTRLPLNSQNIKLSSAPRCVMDEAHVSKQAHMVSFKNQPSSGALSMVYREQRSPNKCVNSCKLKSGGEADDESENHVIVKQLLEQHKGNIPFHDPHLYMAVAGKTKSVPNYRVLAFPDFWGHSSPPFSQKLEEQKCGLQRNVIFEDIQRHLSPSSLLNRVVFDLDNPSVAEGCEEMNCLKFFSKFESGNLRKAIQVREFEYDLIVNADVNTDQHHQWFYFEVSAMRANVPYRFNVINCEKGNSQYNYGMQPVIYSVKEALNGKSFWLRTGSKVCYYKNVFCYRTSEARKRRRYYTLTFTVKFPHYDDVCYLAYHYPYTYSALMSHLQILESRHDPQRIYFKQQTLCDTLGGNPCPMVTITAMPKSKSKNHKEEFCSRHYIVLTARVHPGESNASWVMKGTLEFLISNDPIAEILRELFIFKLIPMLNPDGVINGNHRCSLNGEDLNRHWISPKSGLQPTIYHSKGLLYYLNSIGRSPLVFCDYHGHSQRKNVFFYGCSIKETLWQAGCVVDSSVLLEDVGYRTLPKILDKIAPAFSMAHSSFLVEKARESTARVVVWREIGVARSYTMESTYCGFNQGPYKGLQVGTKELEEMGAKFCLGLLILQSKALYNTSARLPQLEALLEAEKENSDNPRNSTETDDEPPCEEEIDYNTDSCSDQEISESDTNPEGKLTEEKNGAGKDKELISDKEEDDFSSKISSSTRKCLAIPPKQHGCSPEVASPLNEKSYEHSSKTKIGHHYLY
ncbi:cytosolic carboxypeptidase 4 isoform X2 [Hyperolius riggenbachi]|uniref:cytosolic carboxypeptidase 4 isoform X2 n=1 Tax=Hyperolius riggenbachi TaxID=752182 RepID=UPI0035A38CBD